MIRYFTGFTVLTFIICFSFLVFFNISIKAFFFPKREMLAEKFKFNVSGTMSEGAGIVSLCNEFNIKDFSCLVKFLPSVSVAGKVMTEPISKQGSQNCETSGDQGKFVWSNC